MITPGFIKFLSCHSKSLHFPQPMSSCSVAPSLPDLTMSLHTAKTTLWFLFLQAPQRGIHTFIFLKLCFYVYLKIYPLFSPSKSCLICLFPSPLLIHSIYNSSRVFKIRLSPLVLHSFLPLTTLFFRNATPTYFLCFLLRSLPINFLYLDLAPTSILKLLF